ncbi:helix-turn-helix transcriptional regulator [Sulfurospirillum diekertiae]|uniref:Helix-turn-helix transcriptional regulator n=1 Tax=Sulfurospirillum diekertiae TaxID=1854492 RepID=A0A858KDC7_9BACT|nr:helix-turn-helix transcriptional regulator [Sulfurospirillum diekertiae]QIR75840.2 helix-turn-helix transcriptional regulator [Sulfurospirillum diekertiae]QIR78485.2 helix-turn-helix transcriptional regulator [Sulfurospirillum diekertiae]
MKKFDFPEKILEIRKQSGLKQSDFAEKLGVSQVAISNYEKGSRSADVNFVYRLISEFHINPQWFFYDMGMPIEKISFDNSLYTAYLYAAETAKKNEKIDELILMLTSFSENQNALHLVLPKIKSIKGQGVFSIAVESWCGKGERMDIILIKFLRFLEPINLSCAKDNAKIYFIQKLKEFEFSMFAISEKDKSNLVEWVSKELNDLDCYILLLNIPEIIEELKKDINVFNKFRLLFEK